MRWMRCWGAFSLLAVTAASPVSAGAAELALEPCEVPGLDGEARCGTYEVFENRQTRSGRTIPLHVVVLPATGENKKPDPVIFFAGGPGGSTVEGAPVLAAFLSEDLAERDFLLVDYRGTGKSKPLFCPYQEEPKQGIAEALETFLPVDLLDECADALDDTADLARYTTPAIVDDVAEVARALGYENVNLSGGSYASRAVLVFLRRHPEMVRTAVIQGVVPTDARIPVTFARDAQAALDGWFRECAEDPACAAAFPDPAGDLRKVLAELDEGPKSIEVFDAKARETVELRLSRNAFVQALRYMLYSSADSLKIPAFLHAAANGDWQPMAQTAYSVGGFLMASLPDGLYLSVTCTEDVSRIGPNAAAVQTGFLGDFRLRQQVDSCAEWVQGELPKNYYDPVLSDAPVLILSGERDPVTPARWGYQVQEFLPHSVHLVIPDGAHGSGGLLDTDCIGAMRRRLLDTASVEGLDVESCAAAIGRPSFLLEIPKEEEIEMERDELARFAGTYAAEGGGWQVVLEVTDEGLMATFGKETLQMVPIGPLRFKVRGDPPGDSYLFLEEEGTILSFEWIQSGVVEATLVKKPAGNGDSDRD